MTYPKWVSRGHAIGAVLCLNEEEEAQLLADWAERESAPALIPGATFEHKGTTYVLGGSGAVGEAPTRNKPGPKPKVK